MNERLKQHFQQYLDENEGIFYPHQFAQHFYNLALADVRREVEKHAKTYANTISGVEWRKTLDFIDNLTK